MCPGRFYCNVLPLEIGKLKVTFSKLTDNRSMHVGLENQAHRHEMPTRASAVTALLRPSGTGRTMESFGLSMARLAEPLLLCMPRCRVPMLLTTGGAFSFSVARIRGSRLLNTDVPSLWLWWYVLLEPAFGL